MTRISLLISLSFVVRSTLAIVCLDCRGLVQPYECATVTECSTNEVCYIEKYETSNGQKSWHLYNVGCKSPNFCSSSGTALPVIGKRSAIKRIDTTTCHECCSDKDICNLEGHCGSASVTHPVGSTMCYSCPLAMDPNKCNHIALCDRDSACSIKPTQHSIGQPRWSHGCSEKTQCKTIAQSNPQGLCSFCCDTELCNRNCSIESTMAPITPIPQSAPVITTVVKPKNFGYGETVTIQCLATGNPKPTIGFLWNSPTGRIVDNTIQRITIQVFLPRDNGVYQCVASNILGDAHADIPLQAIQGR